MTVIRLKRARFLGPPSPKGCVEKGRGATAALGLVHDTRTGLAVGVAGELLLVPVAFCC